MRRTVTRSIRFATPSDAETVLAFIHALALYEREPDAVRTDAATIARQLGAEHPPFECLLAEVEGRPVGFALFFQNYSTWLGKPGIHLEDLFVLPEERAQGHGKALFLRVAEIAVERDSGRLEWAVLDWNQPAIDFYRSLGSEPLSEWTTERLSGEALSRLGRKTK